jgi:hypothetical protein
MRGNWISLPLKEKEFGPGDSYVKVGPKEWKPTLTGMIIHEAGRFD